MMHANKNNDDKPRIILPPGVKYPEPDDAANQAAEEAAGGAELGGAHAETIAALEQQVADAKAQIESLEGDKLRLRAEFENSRKRLTRTWEDRLKFASQEIILELLQVADNLDRAIVAAEQTNDMKSLLEGLKYVSMGMHKSFTDHGVQPVPTDGQIFDPNLHEAVGVHETGEVPHNSVLQVTQSGYSLYDRVIRPAKVIVSRHPNPPAPVPPVTSETASGSATSNDDSFGGNDAGGEEPAGE